MGRRRRRRRGEGRRWEAIRVENPVVWRKARGNESACAGWREIWVCMRHVETAAEYKRDIFHS